MVAEYREFNDDDPFEPIKLGATLQDPENFNAAETEEQHGALTAVVPYNTDLFFPDGTQVVLSFAMGRDVMVSTILGWPMIKALDLVIALWDMKAYSRELQHEFQIIRHNTVESNNTACADSHPSETPPQQSQRPTKRHARQMQMLLPMQRPPLRSLQRWRRLRRPSGTSGRAMVR